MSFDAVGCSLPFDVPNASRMTGTSLLLAVRTITAAIGETSDHFFVRYDDGLWISVGVEFAMNGETGASGSGGDQVDDYAIADQRFGAPILGDEGEQTVLDLIPLAGARGKVSDGDFDADLVGQMLQLALPQAQTGAIAAAPVSGDEQSFGLDQYHRSSGRLCRSS
jgi:hypothetical protein